MICDKVKVELDDVIISTNGKPIPKRKYYWTLNELDFCDYQSVIVRMRLRGGTST